MSVSTGFVHFCAFNKILANFISPEQIKNVTPGTSEFITLQPAAAKTDGPQVIKIPLSSKKYYLLENRQKIGFDRSLPDEGVLVTFADETEVTKPYKMIRGPAGFVRIKDATPDTEKLSDAALTIKAGRTNYYIDERENLAFVAFPSEGKAMEVYVTTHSDYNKMSSMVDLIVQAKIKIDEVKAAKLKSAEGLSYIKEADDKLMAAIKALKAKDNIAAEQNAKATTELAQKSIIAEQRYNEAQGVMSRADNSIKKAESDGRNKGLDNAMKLLQQARSLLDTYDYDKAIITAFKAKKTAEAATK
jgi:hypothetical protein